LSEIVCEKDHTIPELPVKDVIYRIYRDMRFSSDPTPYKAYFSVSWSRTGRKGPYAHYYLHVQPDGGSFFGKTTHVKPKKYELTGVEVGDIIAVTMRHSHA
jgi:uncharacterized protein (DUF2461 family)